MAQQTTRLDRLLLLLDTGTSATTRRTAAEQIGELSEQVRVRAGAGVHGRSVLTRGAWQLEGGAPHLLARVRRLLRSKSWETRMAAAHAVDAICQRLPVWQPSPDVKMEGGEGDESAKAADPLILEGLAQLDIKAVIDKGQTLVSSTGAEFDDVTDDIADPKERLAAKKQQLRAALGLDAAAGGKGDGMAQVAAKKGDTDLYNMQDLVKDEDVETVAVPQGKGKTGTTKRKASDILEDMRGGGGGEAAAGPGGQVLSARESNQLRRKQRKMMRASKEEAAQRGGGGAGKTEGKSVLTSQPQDDNKVVLESTVVETIESDPNEWPLGALCDDLSHDIFDANWEIRHGAAMALRDILKGHAGSAGKVATSSAAQQDEDNMLWLEECTIRVLCVLALDRFGDYVSDPVVAPVRETCAQVLGVLLRSLAPGSLRHVRRVLADTQAVSEWEVRHGGMLGLKYMVAVRAQAMDAEELRRVLPLLRAGIEGEDDDVRCVAAEALLPLAGHLVTDAGCFAWFGRQLLALLWATIKQLDDLTASTSAVMCLLAAMADHLPSHCAADIGGGAGDGAGRGGGQEAGALMESLYPFFRHSMTSVRRSVLKIAGNLVQLCSKAAGGGNMLAAGLGATLHCVFINVILEQRADILASSHELWAQLLRVAEGAALTNVVHDKVEAWLRAVATPPGQDLDPLILGGGHRKAAKRNKVRKQGGGVIHGRSEGDAARGEEDEGLTNLDDLSASVQMRLSGVRALGALAWRLQSSGGDASMIESQVTTYLTTSNLGTHVQVGALLLAEWAAAACGGPRGATAYALPPALQAALDAKLASVGQTDFPYAEIGDLSSKWRGELLEVLEAFSKAGVKDAAAALKATDVAGLSVMQGLQLAQQASEWEAKVKSKEKDAKKAAEAAKLRSKAARQVCAPQARRGMCAIGV